MIKDQVSEIDSKNALDYHLILYHDLHMFTGFNLWLYNIRPIQFFSEIPISLGLPDDYTFLYYEMFCMAFALSYPLCSSTLFILSV